VTGWRSASSQTETFKSSADPELAATGQVTDACHPRQRHTEFLDFLSLVAGAYPRRRLHVVLDNYATPQAPAGPGLAGQASTGPPALHPDLRLLAPPGRGVPPVYGHDERLRLLATVTQTPPDPASHWSHSQLADALADIGISASQVGRILADLDLKPHQVRGRITRREVPEFWERAADVCGLYLIAPDNALVLAVDEKTGIGARIRTRPAIPPAPGRVARQEHEYVRHGTGWRLCRRPPRSL
jgi:hypothetical protein